MKTFKIFFVFALMTVAFISLSNCTKELDVKSNDQSLLAIKEEFASGHYDKVLIALNQYKDSLETNSRASATRIKAESLENIVTLLNRKLPKTNSKAFVKTSLSKYSSYDISFVDGQFWYSGKEYRTLIKDAKNDDDRLVFVRKYLELNNPFHKKETPQDSQIREFASVAKYLSDGLDDKAAGSQKSKAELSELLLTVFQKLAYASSASDSYKPENLNRYSKDLFTVAEAVVKYSDNKKELVSAYMTMINVYRYKNQVDKARELMLKVIKEHKNDKNAAFAYAWMGDYYYVRGDLDKAKVSYSSADKLFGSASYPMDELRLTVPELDDFDQYKSKIRKMAKLVQSEKEYLRFIQNSRLAIIAADNVRLRQTKETDTSKNVITTLNTGDKVIFVKRSDEKISLEGSTDYWYLVRLRNGNEGWIFGKFLLVF